MFISQRKITEQKDVTKQEENSVFGKSLISTYSFLGCGREREVSFGCGRLFEFEWKGEGAFIRGWALTNFFCLLDGRLFEVGRLFE